MNYCVERESDQLCNIFHSDGGRFFSNGNAWFCQRRRF